MIKNAPNVANVAIIRVGKSDNGPAWFNRIGIDRTCRLVGMYGGIVTLTRTMNDWPLDKSKTHTVWLYDHPLATGDAATMRNRFADHMPGHWLEFIYRSA